LGYSQELGLTLLIMVSADVGSDVVVDVGLRRVVDTHCTFPGVVGEPGLGRKE
jgi:hypothetical protein